ncbi:hypothetical protein VST7929_02772 [Vibrio stylophorae]|uniref:Uncharacterized protein n=1 Tax=Vibrio stylophorae TaxID=659351 RepID=A0ABM8ZWU3_9VIBR|nr:hypothetical protein [Vibrio stylophorae]CAH0535111.1 hypothetical protein VST7929_02772 [Vibrio stylophorae]
MAKAKRQDKLRDKAWKNVHEARFEEMVGKYHQAQKELAAMEAGSEAYAKQKKLCDSLFASAERFFSQHQ